MLTKRTYNKLIWIDLVSPSSEEVKEIMQKYNVHPLVGEELLSPTLKPRLDVYDNFLYLILHFPAIRHTHSNEKNQEVDFIIGKNVLITTRYDAVDSLHEFATEFETSAIIDKANVTRHAGFVFLYMMRFLYRSVSQELEYIENTLGKIEENIFLGKEKQMVRALSNANRSLLDIKQTIQHHGEHLSELHDVSKKFFTPNFAGQLKEIQTEYQHVVTVINDHQEFLKELRETNDSLLSTKQNEVMKVLTIMAFVTFPLTLIAGIFGMNTHYLPLVGRTGDFWVVMGIMALLAGLFFWFFKHKKWL